MKPKKLTLGGYSDDVVTAEFGKRGDSYDCGEKEFRITGAPEVLVVKVVYDDGNWVMVMDLPGDAKVEVFHEEDNAWSKL